ncbi:MAG: hypothetical protein AAF633_18270 [Chloroflexota bacterium]
MLTDLLPICFLLITKTGLVESVNRLGHFMWGLKRDPLVKEADLGVN